MIALYVETQQCEKEQDDIDNENFRDKSPPKLTINNDDGLYIGKENIAQVSGFLIVL